MSHDHGLGASTQMQESPLAPLLTDRFDELPAQMQVAARWLIGHPLEVALLSMREQARRAGVPAATMSRIAKRLGFEGFDDLKALHAQLIREPHSFFPVCRGTLDEVVGVGRAKDLLLDLLGRGQEERRIRRGLALGQAQGDAVVGPERLGLHPQPRAHLGLHRQRPGRVHLAAQR